MTDLKTLKYFKDEGIIAIEDFKEVRKGAIDWIKELRIRPAITLAEMNIGASNYESPKLERELVKMMARLAEQVFSHFFNIKESELK